MNFLQECVNFLKIDPVDSGPEDAYQTLTESSDPRYEQSFKMHLGQRKKVSEK